jgi:hypothetical protein
LLDRCELAQRLRSSVDQNGKGREARRTNSALGVGPSQPAKQANCSRVELLRKSLMFVVAQLPR